MKKKISARQPWDSKRVRALRNRLGISQEAFAHRLGVTFVSVSRWEGGHAKPSPLARRLLDELDLKEA